MEDKENQILKFHIKVLKFLMIWPFDRLGHRQNYYLMRACFAYACFCSIPVFSGAAFQFCVGIDNVKVLLEVLVGVGNITGYNIAYVCFLKNQEKIDGLIRDFQEFVQFSGLEIIQKTEEKTTRYTKYLLSYASIGLVITFIWQMLSTKSCEAQRGGDYYVRHDPCWLPVRNWYPFDASQPKLFWIVFPIEAVYSIHICLFFSLATSTIIGFLMQITSQLQHCSNRFEHVFDEVEMKPFQQTKRDFLFIVKHHKKILEYSKKLFNVFDTLIVVYISLTSFIMAIICYQIVDPKISAQDRIKYAILLIAWCLLVYLICYNGQKVQDEALKIGQSIFKSNWYQGTTAIQLKPYIMFTLARTQVPLEFKAQLFGTISLLQFMKVMKWSYSGLTLLLAVTDED